ISDDEIRQTIEANQLRLIRERGADMTIFSPRASAMAPHVGDQSVAAEARQLWAKAFPGLAKGSYYAQALEAGGKRYWLIAIDNGEALATGQRFFEEQMGWLERELARHAGEPAIVALHIPIGADAKSQAIRERLGRSARVQLILTGHRHTDLVDEVEAGGRKITQVRTAGMHVSATFWRQVRLWEDRIEVSATGEPGKIVATVRLEP
ncbi:MAG: hypothetical protein K2Q23_09945, partial [Bryobacteraceae bacterium]|nr:hypothetical protein [Bryobacteraceae bacterium]